jgi:MFS family permease
MRSWQTRLERIVATLWPLHLDAHERGAFRLHILSALLTGCSAAILNLSDTILAKTLSGTALAVTILNVINGGGYLASAFWAGAMMNRRKAPFVLVAAVVGRLGLAMTGLWREPAWFIAVVGLSCVAEAMIISAQVAIIQRAYRPLNREQVFGATISVNTGVRLVLMVLAGKLLDWNESIYGLLYAVLGACGFAGALLLTRVEAGIDYRQRLEGRTRVYRVLKEPGFVAGLRSAGESVRLVGRILRDDAPFRRFETNFFLYGIAFLSLAPIVPLYLVNDLGLDYTRIGMARGLMGQAGLILFSPLMGRLMRRLKPVRFCAYVFGFLASYPILLLASWFAPGQLQIATLYAAFLCFGIAMAGVSLAWNLSSLYFAGEADPSAYQTVHTVLVGGRGIGAPLLGYLVIQIASNLYGFAVSAALFVLAAFQMARLARGARRRPDPESGSQAVD